MQLININLEGIIQIRPNDLKRFENLTLDDLYHPRIISCCHIFGTIITVLNTVIFPFMIYVIFKHSRKQMGNYKNLLAFQLINSYIFNVITYIWHPVFFWPLTLGIPFGIFNFSTSIAYILMCIETGIIFLIVCIQAFLIIYRFLALFQDSFIHLIYKNSRLFYSIFVICLFGSFSLATVPYWIQDTDASHILKLTEKDVPIIKTLHSMFPTIIGYYPSLSNGNLYLIIAVLVLILFAIPFIFIGISIIFSVRLQTIKLITSPQTFSMHKQLHKAMLVQLLIITIFLLLPAQLFLCFLFFEVQWGSTITPLCAAMVHLHIFLESLNLLYFVKPYRAFVVLMLKNVKYFIFNLLRCILLLCFKRRVEINCLELKKNPLTVI